MTGETTEASRALGRVRLVICHVTQACNLRCAYCFGHPGSASDERMEVGTAEACARLVARHSHSPGVQWIFFGGEPLLAPVDWFRAATAGIEAAFSDNGKTVRFGMQTNGTLIDKRLAQEIRDLGMNPSVSLDGPVDTNDRLREGGAAAVRGIAALREAGLQPTVLTVLGPHNAGRLESVLGFFHQLGLERMRMNLCQGAGGQPFALTAEQLARARLLLVDRLLDGGPAPVDMNTVRGIGYLAEHGGPDGRHGLPCGAARCGAGVAHLSVLPDGSLYPCDRAVDERWKLGTVHDLRGRRYVPTVLAFHARHAVDRGCPDCTDRMTCYFGCTAVRGDPAMHRELCEAGRIVGPVLRSKRAEIAGWWLRNRHRYGVRRTGPSGTAPAMRAETVP